MNERIKELAEQAVYYDEDEESWEFDRKKFAELIIQEVHYVIVVGGVDDLDIVLEHFGVEE